METAEKSTAPTAFEKKNGGKSALIPAWKKNLRTGTSGDGGRTARAVYSNPGAEFIRATVATASRGMALQTPAPRNTLIADDLERAPTLIAEPSVS